MSPAPDIIQKVRKLATSYIRGERTAAEIRGAARRDDSLAGLAAGCIGVSTFPHELLEQAGIDPFLSEIEFDPPLSITREGMLRNLDLAEAGELPPVALSDWATDWFSWQVAARPDDEVILELAGELMLGEEPVEEILNDPFRIKLVRWHLSNTPAPMGGTVAFGLQVAAHREQLVNLVRSGPDDAGTELSRMFGETLEAMPGLGDDLEDALRRLAEADSPEEEIRRFLEQVARTADPLTAVESGPG